MQLNCTLWIVNDVLIARCTAVTYDTYNCCCRILRNMSFLFTWLFSILNSVSVCVSRAHKPIWRDRRIDLLRSCSNQMHELDFLSPLLLISLDACSLTSHSHCTLDFRYVLHVRVRVYAATCTSLVTSYHPLLRFLRPFMQFCTTQFGSCLNFSFSFFVILNFHSFRLTLLPITNGWHNFPCIVCAQRIRLFWVGFCLRYPNVQRIWLWKPEKLTDFSF